MAIVRLSKVKKELKMKKLFITTMLVGTIALTTGCAPRGYSHSSIGQNMSVEAGVVQSVKQVIIDNKGVGNAVGGVVGTIAGGIAGDHVGGGSGRVVATAVGAAIGGTLGGTIGNQIDTNYGQEVVVKLNNGKTVATVLRINESSPALRVGEVVNVFTSGGKITNISAK